MQHNYSISEHIAVRKDEGILFDSEKFVVHKVNETGMRIIISLMDEPIQLNEIHNKCSEIPMNDIKEFIEEAVDAGFIVEAK